MNISKIVEEYLIKFDEDRELLHQLLALIEKCNSDDELTSTQNYDGHITSSAILVSRKSKKMLKIMHKDLKMYLQPGGHIPSHLNPLQNAKQILENLGIVEITFVPDSNNELIPLDIDTHTIPANYKLGIPAHTHHDLRYLFVCEEEFKIQGMNFNWENIPELRKYGTYCDLIDKVQILWSKEYDEKQFYNSIVDKIKVPKDTTFIVVQHFLPGVDHFLRSLASIGRIGMAIPKPKSLQKEIMERLDKIYPVYPIKRLEISKNEKVAEILELNKRVIFIDIGGWFANDLMDLCKKYRNNIIGVVEDTENGHQKYENTGKLPCPVVSVARSPLKLNEDTLIGQSIVFSSDSILRDQNKLLKYMKCGVFGYGKVGKSIAYDLIAKSIKPIVYDTNPLKLIEAYNDGCSIGDRDIIFKNCDAVFCATGNNSIKIDDLNKLRRGIYIFSVTSADDEFNFQNIEDRYKHEIIDENVTRYYQFDNSFFLVNKGNAVNFIHRAVVGDFIHLVKAEMLMAVNDLYKSSQEKKIIEVSNENRKIIADLWLKSFHNIKLPEQL